MVAVDQKVMDFVEQTLKQDPGIQLEELFRRATEVSDSIRDLSKRQFNARYPLQVKRRIYQATGKKEGSRKKTPSPSKVRSRRSSAASADGSREAVRGVFLEFATDIAGAEERKDLVRVLANVDRYVSQVLKGLS